MFASEDGPAGQDDIDALFAGDDAEGEEVSQDDIDALFD